MPVKLATAPISVRPWERRAISAPTSKSSRWMRTLMSAARHWRKERDLARARDLRVGFHVGLVDRGADHLRVLERIGIFLATPSQPRNQLTDRAHARRRVDLFLGLPDALAHPGEIEKFHDRLSSNCAQSARARLIIDQMPYAGTEVIPAGIERQQGRKPQQDNSDVRGNRQDLVAGLAGDQEADREQLQKRLPLCERSHRHADATLGEVFAQAGDENLAA